MPCLRAFHLRIRNRAESACYNASMLCLFYEIVTIRLWANNSTRRELDVNAIREESERALLIACVGHAAALDQLEPLLRRGPERYPTPGPNPLEIIPLEHASERAAGLASADMLLLAVDARQPL